jgi:hypothetical protein
MFRKNRNKNANKSLHLESFNFLISLPVKLIKATINEVNNLIQETISVTNAVSLKTLSTLKISYQQIEKVLTPFVHWVMQFKIVQLIVEFAKRSGIAIQIFLSETSIQFKTFVVNYTSTKAFVLIARVLPIGDWLKYEEQDEFGNSSFSKAIEDKDFVLLDRILTVISEEALYRYLFMKDCVGIGPLQYSFFHCGEETTATQKIVNAIKPEKRLWVFNKLITNKELVIFSLVRGKDEAFHCEIVMQSLPEKDKAHFMNQVNANGSSPILLQAMGGESWEQIKTFLDHYPKERLMDYLNIINERKETFFTEAASNSPDTYIGKIIELVPEQERAAYLSKHHQGLKALLYAKANYDYCAHQIPVLENFGIKIPEQYETLTPDELKEKLPHIFEEVEATEVLSREVQSVRDLPNEHTVRENFKLKHGVFPLAVLNVDEAESNVSNIKSAYRKLMLFCHPDKNNSTEESTSKTILINEAYGVYVKPEIRKSYYKI